MFVPDPLLYDKYIDDFTLIFDHQNWSRVKTTKKCFRHAMLYEHILEEENTRLYNQRPGDPRPNRLLFVYNQKRQTHTLTTRCDGSILLNTALVPALNSIVTLQDANKFIDKYGLCYPESVYSLGPLHTLEILLSSFEATPVELRRMAVEISRCFRLSSSGRINIVRDVIYENYGETRIRVLTLKRRISIFPQEYWPVRDRVDYFLRIFKRKILRWRLVCDIIEENFGRDVNRQSLAILRELSRIRCLNYRLKKEGILNFKALYQPPQISFDLEKYWDEIIFRKSAAYVYYNMRALSCEIKNQQFNTYFRQTFLKNTKFLKAYERLNMHFLDSTCSIRYFLVTNRMSPNVLIYHDQDLIMEHQAGLMSDICKNLDKLVFKYADRQFEVNYVLVDYDLHANDYMLGTDQKLSEMSYFKKRIHLVMEWLQLPFLLPEIRSLSSIKTQLNLSKIRQVGVINMTRYNIGTSMLNYNRLDFSQNCIVTVDGDNFSTDNSRRDFIEILLNKNRILNLDAGFVNNLHALTSLNLSSNFLRILNICSTNIECQLKHLDLSNNRLSIISVNAFHGLAKLETLRLSSNLLQALDPNLFGYLGNLQVLDLDNNQISYVDVGAFRGMHTLKELRLSRNKIKALGVRLFAELRELEILDLSFNNICDLRANVFSDLVELKQLYLQNNWLYTLSDMLFTRESELRVLFLQANKISFVSPLAFTNLNKLTVLLLFSNNLPAGFNYRDIATRLPNLKKYYYEHESSQLKDFLLYEKIHKYLD